MERKLYPVVIEKGGDGYGAMFPDFPGCVSQADTLEETFIAAHEALAGHAAVMLDYDEVLPEPSPLDAVLADPENHESTVLLVGLTRPGRSLHVNVALDKHLVEAISETGADLASFLADAARAELARRLAG